MLVDAAVDYGKWRKTAVGKHRWLIVKSEQKRITEQCRWWWGGGGGKTTIGKHIKFWPKQICHIFQIYYVSCATILNPFAQYVHPKPLLLPRPSPAWHEEGSGEGGNIELDETYYVLALPRQTWYNCVNFGARELRERDNFRELHSDAGCLLFDRVNYIDALLLYYSCLYFLLRQPATVWIFQPLS